MRDKIAIDIDQTLYDFDSQIREAFFELALETGDKSFLKGAYSTNMEWRNLTDVLGVDTALKAIGMVHDRTLEQTPFEWSVSTVNELKHAGFEIKYVTSRLAKYQVDTEDWLTVNRFPEGDVICSSHDKTEHIEDCRYLIDDRPKTIIDFVTNYDWKLWNTGLDSERKAFGLWTPYNRNLTDVDNVYLAPTWRGIAYYLKRKGLL